MDLVNDDQNICHSVNKGRIVIETLRKCQNDLHFTLINTPFPVSPKGEMISLLLPPWGKAGKGVMCIK
jgi:hypothetical protein